MAVSAAPGNLGVDYWSHNCVRVRDSSARTKSCSQWGSDFSQTNQDFFPNDFPVVDFNGLAVT
jgi:hypothetical protein